jgi:HTH-type transcriptional repressor of NAD biosynthesis genes
VSQAFVLMTALPPTKGHWHLMQFAGHVADETCVIVATQPGEPYVRERVDAISSAATRVPGCRVVNIHETLPQRPHGDPAFWEMWRRFLENAGCRGAGDFIVASESYGATLAQVVGAEFIPFDLAREMTPTRATEVRRDPEHHFADIMVEFQPFVRQRVTIMGAESTGKTTLSRQLAKRLHAHWLPEWARPYLEQLPTPDVDDARMHAIWRGQRALQNQGQELSDRPWVVHDTDLFATVGYWDHWSPGETPTGLVADALTGKSDLYLVTRSNIPFEPDPLRYGIHQRETTDDYWIGLAERYGLNYRVVEEATPQARLEAAKRAAREHFAHAVHLTYERQDND